MDISQIFFEINGIKIYETLNYYTQRVLNEYGDS